MGAAAAKATPSHGKPGGKVPAATKASASQGDQGGTWRKYTNIDMCFQGDAEIIGDWKRKHSIDDLKRIVERKGYSAVCVGSFGHAALKSFDYQLEATHCKPSQGYTNELYIFFPDGERAKPAKVEVPRPKIPPGFAFHSGFGEAPRQDQTAHIPGIEGHCFQGDKLNWPLHWAAMIGDVRAINALVECGHEPNGKMGCWFDSEPLGWAASFGQCKAIEALCAAGADPRRPANLAGCTPLKDAQREGHTKAIALLEEYLSGARALGELKGGGGGGGDVAVMAAQASRPDDGGERGLFLLRDADFKGREDRSSKQACAGVQEAASLIAGKPSARQYDTCYALRGKSLVTIPAVGMHEMGNGAKWSSGGTLIVCGTDTGHRAKGKMLIALKDVDCCFGDGAVWGGVGSYDAALARVVEKANPAMTAYFWHSSSSRLIEKPKDRGANWVGYGGYGWLFLWADAQVVAEPAAPEVPVVSAVVVGEPVMDKAEVETPLPLVEIVEIIKQEVGVDGTISDVVARGCAQLGVKTQGKSLIEQANECVKMLRA